jgi:hypothetical protein
MSINLFSLLKYFHATYFCPFRQLLGVYKQQKIFMFIPNLRDAMNPFLIVLSYRNCLH